ncbi:phosphate acetyltransferase [bacterium]|nr:phosphate acetyltransferase [bacterium]
MSRNLYVTINEPMSGKSAISLGLMELLSGTILRVGFFRPIARVHEAGSPTDANIELIRSHFRLEDDPETMYGVSAEKARDLVAHGHVDELLETIIERYKAYEADHDFTLIEGTNYEGVISAFEFDMNALIARNLGAPVLMILKGQARSVDEIVSAGVICREEFRKRGCDVDAAIVNMVDAERLEDVRGKLQDRLALEHIHLLGVLPEEKLLSCPSTAEICQALRGRVIHGEQYLDNVATGFRVAAMRLENCLERIPAGALVIVPGDRQDIIAGLMASQVSTTMDNIAGMVLTAGLEPAPAVSRLMHGLHALRMPIFTVETNTYDTATAVHAVKSVIRPDSHRKIDTVLSLFARHVDTAAFREKIAIEAPEALTPRLFLHKILHMAARERKHIVLPEGREERILRATEALMRRDLLDITLLGDEEKIRGRAAELKLDLGDARILDPAAQDNFEDYAQTYHELRKHKNIPIDIARDCMADPIFYGTMMVHKGDADGLVAGSITTTRETLRPAFEFIKTKPGISLISSVFFMCLEDRVLVYGDCAVNPNPTAPQLADIAISSAETARSLGIEPIVAMLSWSTGKSGSGGDVDKVAEAVEIARKLRPDLAIEGPIQYDAAVDAGVAATKLPGSKVAGHATVFIFPDLNAGNNTYKAVQRSAHALAIGHVLQGLRKPVNDLSRGALVEDIVNTVAITAIQAQSVDA